MSRGRLVFLDRAAVEPISPIRQVLITSGQHWFTIIRYAHLPALRRLAIAVGDHVAVYDTTGRRDQRGFAADRAGAHLSGSLGQEGDDPPRNFWGPILSR
jgi:hypothetical protein